MADAAARKLPGWPQFDEEQVEAAARVLRSGAVNYWTGSECKAFELEYAQTLGVEHAIAVANGTVALDLALQALGVGPGAEVIVTPRSFVASASCVVMAGARPVFADVDRDSGNITPSTVAAALTPRTRAVIAVHLGGWPCELEALREWCDERGIWLLEDCAQAHGATYRGKAVGAWGHVAAFSFCQDKIITTGGEGGLLATQDRAVAQRLWSLKEHGKSYTACFEKQWPPGFRWLHEGFGGNGRMTELQAALGRIQLARLAATSARRRQLAQRLGQAWSGLESVRDPQPPAFVQHAQYKRYCYVEPRALRQGWSRDRLLTTLVQQGVPCFAGSCSEIYLEKAFVDAGLQPHERLPVARELGETSLQFLVHPTLSDADVDWMCGKIRQVLEQASA